MFKKSLFPTIAIYFIMIILFSGCVEFGTEVQDDRGKITGEIVVMTAKEHNEDIILDMDWSDGYSILYDSLDDGDSLIIQDKISDILYDDIDDVSIVFFRWVEGDSIDYLSLAFEGDITKTYKTGDTVEISLTIKYVNFYYEELNFELEIYQEQWENEEYFKNDADSGGDGFKPLPQNCIKVV